MPHDLQGNRFLELLEEHPLEVYLLNTGRVGGGDDGRALEEGADQALVGDRQGHRRRDDRVGARPQTSATSVAAAVPGIDDDEVLSARKLYERTGR
jgi:phosphoenolpyruvate carboxykinase (ATP)